MNDQADDHDRADEAILTHDVSDEALEVAATPEGKISDGTWFYTFTPNLCCA